MADLGTLTTKVGLLAKTTNKQNRIWGAVTTKLAKALYPDTLLIASYAAGSIAWPRNGSISGVTSKDGVAQPNVLVRLFWKGTGFMIRQVRSGVNGNFTFAQLNPASNQYIVIAHLADYNIVAFDSITPV